MEDLKTRIDAYRRRRAINISVAVMMYILGAAILIALSIFFPSHGGEIGVILLLVFVAAATGLIIYTNLSIPQDLRPYFDDEHPSYPGYDYNPTGSSSTDANSSGSTEVAKTDGSAGSSGNAENYGADKNANSNNGTGYYGCGNAASRKSVYKNPVMASVMKLYWLIVTIIYLGISFATMAWYITWLIWLIGAAVEQAIKLIYVICSDRRI